jgi:hypothetical protein
MYKLTKVSAVKARTQAINQLKAVLITADPALREKLAGLGNAELFPQALCGPGGLPSGRTATARNPLIAVVVQLLRYLSDAPLHRRVTAATNKVEASNGLIRSLVGLSGCTPGSRDDKGRMCLRRGRQPLDEPTGLQSPKDEVVRRWGSSTYWTC